MRVAKLKGIADDGLLESSNVVTSSLDEYASGTTYATDDQVKVRYKVDRSTLRYPVEEYTSLADNNTGNYPPTNPSKWQLNGVSNRWAMFDGFVNTQTEKTDSIAVELDASNTDLAGLFRLQAKEISFALSSGGEVKWSETIDLKTLSDASWYDYFFSDWQFQEDVLFTYTKYSDATLAITITWFIDELAECGNCSIGSAIQIGNTQYEPSTGIIDYSKKTTDALGRTYLKQGNFAKRAEVELWLYNSQVDAVRKALTDIRGTPAIFDCNNQGVNGTDYTSLVIYGFYRAFDISIPGPVLSRCSLDIEGLT